MKPKTKPKKSVIVQKMIQGENFPLILISFCGFLFLMLTGVLSGYGYFNDEFYYIACAKRLAFGYVDHPPLAPILLSINRSILGDSLAAIRMLPSLAFGATIFLTGIIARKLGGGRYAQVLAGLVVCLSPLFLLMYSFYSMNAFEPLIMAACILLLIEMVQKNKPQNWLWIGLLTGLGLLNKHTFGVFIGILLICMLLTPLRRYFLNKFFWLAGLIALVVFLPNIIWEIQHHFISLEFYRNINLYKNMPTEAIPFILTQIRAYHPLLLPIWLSGVIYLLFINKNKDYRFFGFFFILTFGFFLLTKTSRPDRVASAYPVVFAGGAVLIEMWLRRLNWNWLKAAIISLLVVSGIVIDLTVTPVLAPAQLAAYNKALGVGNQQFEKGKARQINQVIADRLGWEVMAEDVARVYHKLTPEEKSKTLIFASNYGKAGALEFYSPRYNLPRVISSHNNYWLWGYGDKEPEVVITIGVSRTDLLNSFGNVEYSGVCFSYEYCSQGVLPIYICRKLKMPLREGWERIKNFI